MAIDRGEDAENVDSSSMGISTGAQTDVQLPRTQHDEKLAKAVWDITAGPGGEVESGLLKGPYTPEQIAEQLGKLWVPARRFGLQQGTKIRPVDDFTSPSTERTEPWDQSRRWPYLE